MAPPKFFGGYRFNESLGVEGGYAALGSFSQSVTLGGATVRQDGKASSLVVGVHFWF